jgi:hypothetical protein
MSMKKIETPRGSGARSMTALSPTSVNVNFDQSGQDWFGPRTPMLPIAPPEIAGRALDFLPGFNLHTQPRVNEPVTFEMLRALADVDIVRLVIERRKDQVCRMPWTIRLKHDGDGKRPSSAKLSPAVRSTIREVREFFKQPNYGVGFREWLRVILEDHFTIDAVALWYDRGRRGELLYMRNTDGALVKRNIDTWGETPKPIPWDGRTPFDWNGMVITLENFTTQGFKYVNGYALAPAYQFCLKGLPAIDYTTHDLLYKIANPRSHSLYGFSPVEQIISTINTAMRRSASQLEYFQSGNMPEALYSLPETWSPDMISRYQDYFDALFAGNLANRRQMKFVAGGSKSSFIPIKEPPLKNDFDEWLARIVCFCFSYPPSALMTMNNRSVTEQHDKTGEEEGLQTTKLFVSDLINGIIDNEFDDAVEFAWIEEDEVNQEKQSEILTRYVEDGVLSINEIRTRLGEEPSNDPGANTLMVKTATGYAPIGEHPGSADPQTNNNPSEK